VYDLDKYTAVDERNRLGHKLASYCYKRYYTSAAGTGLVPRQFVELASYCHTLSTDTQLCMILINTQLSMNEIDWVMSWHLTATNPGQGSYKTTLDKHSRSAGVALSAPGNMDCLALEGLLCLHNGAGTSLPQRIRCVRQDATELAPYCYDRQDAYDS
jgi:hypothetical protein